MAYDYDLIHVAVDDGVAIAIIDAPPMNVMTIPLYLQLAGFCAEVAIDDGVRVVVFRSADPDFFIAHFDVEAILQFPTEGDPVRESTPNPFHQMCEHVRTMPKATIAEIDGRVGGGGSEFASSCDMRFGAIGRTVVNQMEVPLGILPGGTGTQRLPRLVGRGRAMEIVLGGVDIDAVTAERWGYLEPRPRAHRASAFRRCAGDADRRLSRGRDRARQAVRPQRRAPSSRRGHGRGVLPVPTNLARPESTGGDETVPRARRSDPRRRAAGGRRRHRALAEL